MSEALDTDVEFTNYVCATEGCGRFSSAVNERQMLADGWSKVVGNMPRWYCPTCIGVFIEKWEQEHKPTRYEWMS